MAETLNVSASPESRLEEWLSGDICRYLKASERTEIWESANGPVPEGQRVGWTCYVPYCGKLEHMELAPNKNYGKVGISPIKKQLKALKVGEFIEVPMPKNPIFFRCNIGMNFPYERFVIRGTKYGKTLRVYRTGTWNNLKKALEIEAAIPKVWIGFRKARNPLKYPAMFGLLTNAPSMHQSEAAKLVRPCEMRGCPYPRNGGNLCFRHTHFYEYGMSMEWRGLDLADIYADRFSSNFPLFTTMKAWEIPNSDNQTVFIHRGTFNHGATIGERWLHKHGESIVSNLQHGTTSGRKGWGKKKIRKSQRRREAGWGGSRPAHDPVGRWSREKLEDISREEKIAQLIAEQKADMDC